MNIIPKNSSEMVFYNSRKTWKITWSIAVIVYLLSWYFEISFFYIHWYLFFVGSLSLLYSCAKYAIVNENGFIFFLGVIDRKCFFWTWDQISRVGTTIIRKNRYHSGGSMPTEHEDDYLYIYIKFEAPLDKKQVFEIESVNRRNGFLDQIEVIEEGCSLLLKQKPEGGYERFLHRIKKFCPVEILEDEFYKHRKIFCFLLFYNFALIVIVIFVIIFTVEF